MKLVHDNKDKNRIEIKRTTKNPGNHLTPFLPTILLNPIVKTSIFFLLSSILYSLFHFFPPLIFSKVLLSFISGSFRGKHKCEHDYVVNHVQLILLDLKSRPKHEHVHGHIIM